MIWSLLSLHSKYFKTSSVISGKYAWICIIAYEQHSNRKQPYIAIKKTISWFDFDLFGLVLFIFKIENNTQVNISHVIDMRTDVLCFVFFNCILIIRKYTHFKYF